MTGNIDTDEWIREYRRLASAILSSARDRLGPDELARCRKHVRACVALIKPGLDWTQRREIGRWLNRLQQEYCPPSGWVTGPHGPGYE